MADRLKWHTRSMAMCELAISTRLPLAHGAECHTQGDSDGYSDREIVHRSSERHANRDASGESRSSIHRILRFVSATCQDSKRAQNRGELCFVRGMKHLARSLALC